MATMKRRVVYLSDEEWAQVETRALALGLTFSGYVRKLIEWRQPEANSARDPFERFNTQPFSGPIPKKR